MTDEDLTIRMHVDSPPFQYARIVYCRTDEKPHYLHFIQTEILKETHFYLLRERVYQFGQCNIGSRVIMA